MPKKVFETIGIYTPLEDFLMQLNISIKKAKALASKDPGARFNYKILLEEDLER